MNNNLNLKNDRYNNLINKLSTNKRKNLENRIMKLKLNEAI